MRWVADTSTSSVELQNPEQCDATGDDSPKDPLDSTEDGNINIYLRKFKILP